MELRQSLLEALDPIEPVGHSELASELETLIILAFGPFVVTVFCQGLRAYAWVATIHHRVTDVFVALARAHHLNEEGSMLR